jgi:hypothetical protein
MLKNISFLALAGALASMTACIVVTDDGNTLGDSDTAGDGDGDTAGDGDGDTATETAGDGDGDTAGDGDGDGDTAGDGDGDGDGDALCGWNPDGVPPGYYCGFMGEDPGGTPIGCPDGLVDGAECGEVTGSGCCDADGNNWYCGEENGAMFLVFESCAG